MRELDALSRRDVMRMLAAGAVASTAGRSTLLAQTRRATSRPTIVAAATAPADAEPFRIALGRTASVTVVSDGTLFVEPRKLFPSVAPAELTKACAAAGVPVERHALPVGVALIERGSDRVLIDAGSGTTQGPTAGHLIVNLRRHGVEPESITGVAVTHGHLEQIGGLLDAAGKPAFANAKVWIEVHELEYFSGKQKPFWPDDSPLPAAVKRQRFDRSAAILRSLNGRIETFLAGKAVANDVVRGCGGTEHSARAIDYMTRVNEKKAEDIYILGDGLAPFAMQMAHPEWPSADDGSGKYAAASRVSNFKGYARDGRRILCTHAPAPFLGLIVPDGGGYRLKPQLDQPPY